MEEWKKNAVLELDITGYTAEGMGVSRWEGRVVFVPFTIRGERWKVRLEKVNRSVAWGRGTRLLVPSRQRLPSDCPLFGRCGGCQFRHMTYQEELLAKGQRVQDALERVGNIHLSVPPVLGAEQPDRYRNKVQFPVAPAGEGEVQVGYYRARSHSVLPVEDCMLQPEAVSELRAAFRDAARTLGLSAYDERTGKGLLRHFYVRTNSRDEALACIVINGTHLPHGEEMAQTLRTRCPGLVGIVVNCNRRDTNVILGPDFFTLWGQDWLEEELLGVPFRLSVPSFFQINRAQTQRLYALALDFAGLTGKETVLDLYCGIGTISLCMAKRAGKVIGAEIVPQAIEDARANAARGGVTNAEFFCGDAAQIAHRLGQEGVRPQVICVDPPRKGLAPEVPAILAGMAPERIVYVSCDPATLARDLQRLDGEGYRAEKIQPVDLFPRTAHIENVVLLTRKDP